MKVCFIIPIYPPDYKYAKNFLISKKKFNFKNIDIYYIFSTIQDKLNFDNIYIIKLNLPNIIR